MQNQNITLTELITRATEHLNSLNYRKGTVSHYVTTWNFLKKYAGSKGVSTFTFTKVVNYIPC